jgi:hypothetical protein
VLYINDSDFGGPWGYFGSLPVLSKTVVFLRSVGIGTRGDLNNLDPRQLVVDNCYMSSKLIGDTLYQFRRLKTLVLSETQGENLVSIIYSLPSSIQRVHLLQHNIDIDDLEADHPGVRSHLPRLESFTFTLFQPSAISESQSSAADDLASDALVKLQQAVETMVDAPQCTFKYLQTAKWSDDALADASAKWGISL